MLQSLLSRSLLSRPQTWRSILSTRWLPSNFGSDAPENEITLFCCATIAPGAPKSKSLGNMIALAPLLEGQHDFTAFAASDDRDELELSKVRSIFCSRLTLDGERLIYRATEIRGRG